MLHVHEWGDRAGDPVVCLHGVMGHGGRFRRLAHDRLLHRRVVAFDLRGHGRSSWEPPWNLEQHLDDVVRALDATAAGPADIVGFSFGGRLALELAAAAPERVRSLALLDPAIHIAPGSALAFADGVRPDASFATHAEAIDARMATLAHSPYEMIAEDIAEAVAPHEDGRLHYRVCRSAVVAGYGEMARPPRIPSAPTTLLVRAADGIVHDEHEQLLRNALGARLTVVPVPGTHAVLWDAYEATADAVASHLGA